MAAVDEARRIVDGGPAPRSRDGERSRSQLVVGVLAVQGDSEAHARSVRALGHVPRFVKRREHLQGCDALLLPGGESTTMLKFLRAEGLDAAIVDFCASGRPVFGTCAGAILLATRVTGPEQPSLGVLDVTVERNAYGRQLDSFVAHAADDAGDLAGIELVFIRAPIVREVGPDVEVVLEHGGLPVLVRHGNVWAATFHPEMTDDARLLARVLADARPS